MKQHSITLLTVAMLGLASYFLYEDTHRSRIEHIDAAVLEENHNSQSSFTALLAYRSKYMGDFVNISHLNGELPFTSSHPFTMQLYPDQLSAEIIFSNQLSSKEVADWEKDFIYSAAINLVLIDNLEKYTYRFSDAAYYVTKKDMADWLGIELSDLQNEEAWNLSAASKLSDEHFSRIFFEEKVKRSES